MSYDLPSFLTILFVLAVVCSIPVSIKKFYTSKNDDGIIKDDLLPVKPVPRVFGAHAAYALAFIILASSCVAAIAFLFIVFESGYNIHRHIIAIHESMWTLVVIFIFVIAVIFGATALKKRF